MTRCSSSYRKNLAKIVAISLVFFTVFPLLCSCERVNYDQVKEDAIVYFYDRFLQYDEITSCLNKNNDAQVTIPYHDIYINITSYPDVFSPWPDELPTYAPKNGEEIMIGTKNHVICDIEAYQHEAIKELVYRDEFVYEDQSVYAFFTQDGRLLGGGTSKTYHEDENIGIEKSRGVAVEFINDKLINEYGIDIDLSEYELVASHALIDYNFVWVMMINGYCVSKLMVETYLDGNIRSFLFVPPPVNDIENNKFLLMSERNMKNITFSIIEEKLTELTDKGYEIVFERIYVPEYTLRSPDINLFYLQELNKYMIPQLIDFRIKHKEKNIDILQTAYLLIPLD